MKTKNIIGLLLIGLLLSLVGYWFWENNRNSTDKNASTGHGVQWETYKNKKYGYTEKYPKGWNVNETKKRMPNQTENLGATLNDEYGEIQRVTFVDSMDGFMVNVLSNPEKLNLEQWIKKIS
jgi:hypothetical protein